MDEEEFRLKMCESKIRYISLKIANKALRSIKKTGKIISSDFIPYKCNYCNGGYHLGHSKYRESSRGR